MTRNPYYWMTGKNAGGGTRLALATLRDAGRQIFLVEGRQTMAAGRAKGLTVAAADEGGLFLCAGSDGGWFVLCRLEEL